MSVPPWKAELNRKKAEAAAKAAGGAPAAEKKPNPWKQQAKQETASNDPPWKKKKPAASTEPTNNDPPWKKKAATNATETKQAPWAKKKETEEPKQDPPWKKKKKADAAAVANKAEDEAAAVKSEEEPAAIPTPAPTLPSAPALPSAPESSSASATANASAPPMPQLPGLPVARKKVQGVEQELSPEEQRAQKREKLIKQIVASEHAYVAMLTLIKDRYATPLLTRPKQAAMNSREAKMCFGTLGPVLEVHQKLLEALDERLQNLQLAGNDTLGDIFVQHIQHMEAPYLAYAAGQAKAVDFLSSKVKKSNPLKKFVANRLAAKMMAPQFYLALPTSRPLRYVLLLKDLSKNTEAEHKDSELLRQAIIKCEGLGRQLDAAAKDHQTGNKVILQDLQLQFTKQTKLYKQGRRFQFLSPLQLEDQSMTYIGVMFNDQLILATRSATGKLKEAYVLPIDSSFSVEQLPDGYMTLRSTLKTVTVRPQKSWKEEWLQSFQELVGDRVTTLLQPDDEEDVDLEPLVTAHEDDEEEEPEESADDGEFSALDQQPLVLDEESEAELDDPQDDEDEDDGVTLGARILARRKLVEEMKVRKEARWDRAQLQLDSTEQELDQLHKMERLMFKDERETYITDLRRVEIESTTEDTGLADTPAPLPNIDVKEPEPEPEEPEEEEEEEVELDEDALLELEIERMMKKAEEEREKELTAGAPEQEQLSLEEEIAREEADLEAELERQREEAARVQRELEEEMAKLPAQQVEEEEEEQEDEDEAELRDRELHFLEKQRDLQEEQLVKNQKTKEQDLLDMQNQIDSLRGLLTQEEEEFKGVDEETRELEQELEIKQRELEEERTRKRKKEEKDKAEQMRKMEELKLRMLEMETERRDEEDSRRKAEEELMKTEQELQRQLEARFSELESVGGDLKSDEEVQGLHSQFQELEEQLIRLEEERLADEAERQLMNQKLEETKAALLGADNEEGMPAPQINVLFDELKDLRLFLEQTEKEHSQEQKAREQLESALIDKETYELEAKEEQENVKAQMTNALGLLAALQQQQQLEAQARQAAEAKLIESQRELGSQLQEKTGQIDTLQAQLKAMAEALAKTQPWSGPNDDGLDKSERRDSQSTQYNTIQYNIIQNEKGGPPQQAAYPNTTPEMLGQMAQNMAPLEEKFGVPINGPQGAVGGFPQQQQHHPGMLPQNPQNPHMRMGGMNNPYDPYSNQQYPGAQQPYPGMQPWDPNMAPPPGYQNPYMPAGVNPKEKRGFCARNCGMCN